MNGQRWTVHDRYGNQIYMTQERWQHALEKRPWLEAYFHDVLATLRRGRRTQDPLNPQKYKYTYPFDALFPEFNTLVVVVLFKPGPNNYVVNVWPIFRYSSR